MKILKIVVVLAMASILLLLIIPTLADSRDGHGWGRGGGHNHFGGPSGDYFGGHYYPRPPAYDRSPGPPVINGPIHRHYSSIPFFAGIGLINGFWASGFYYTYPLNDVCREFIPTGSYIFVTLLQSPVTRQWIEIYAPNGYWRTIPCP